MPPILNQTFAEPEDLDLFSFSQKFFAEVPIQTRRANLEAASAKIASYLAAQFTLPLVQWGMDLRRCACVLATWPLAVQRGYNPDADADDNIKALYDAEMEWLREIKEGTVTPVVIDSATADGSPIVVSSTQRGFSTRGTDRTPTPFEGD